MKYHGSCFSVLLFWSAVLCDVPTDILWFGVKTHNSSRASSRGSLVVTLWFDFNIYNFSVVSPQANTEYFAYNPSSTHSKVYTFSFIGGYCEDEAKIMLENDHRDSIYIDTIKVQTASGKWYAIDSICRPLLGEEMNGNIYLYHGNDSLCPSGYFNYYVIPIDNTVGEMAPYKQIIYFNTSTPNISITEAKWSDATNPDIVPVPDDNCDNADDAQSLPIYVVVIIVVFIGLFVLFVVFMVFRFYRKRRKSKESKYSGVDTKPEQKDQSDDAVRNADDALVNWLDSLELSQYVDGFASNGYETLGFVKEINDEKQLEEIGVVLKGHQLKIMNAVKRLSLESNDTGNEHEIQVEGLSTNYL